MLRDQPEQGLSHMQSGVSSARIPGIINPISILHPYTIASLRPGALALSSSLRRCDLACQNPNTGTYVLHSTHVHFLCKSHYLYSQIEYSTCPYYALKTIAGNLST
jgi:hypothetical protein